MKRVYVDGEGVENVAVGIVRQARKDFIRGAKMLYGILHYIPTYEELIKYPSHATLPNSQDIRWMYDAWRFVIQDPYQFFGDEKQVINAWKDEAILKYYEELYLKAGEKLYTYHPLTKKIHTLEDDRITELMNDNKLAGEYIAARNYISKLENGSKIIKELNIKALGRSRHPVTRKRPQQINKSEYIQNVTDEKRKKIRQAKEMYAEGMSYHEIAKELEVTINSVRVYLRS